jgi:hypothetical protein
VVGAAASAVVVRGGGGAATGLDVVGAGVVGAAVLRGFAFTFVAVAPGAGADVVVTVSEARAEARAEELAIGEVLLAGVVFPPPVAIPIMASTAKPTTATPTLCSFFIGGPSDGPPLSA